MNLAQAVESVCTTSAMKAAEVELLSKLSQGCAALDIEYAELEVTNDDALRSTSYSDAQAHREGNRYCDVLPYNYNRVRLRDVPRGTRGGDYLNASLVTSEAGAGGSGQGGGAQRPQRLLLDWSYIVAQGPLEHTCPQFWQAVCEQRCSAIIMLTNCVERNMVKCSRYFPSQPSTKKTFGRMTVKTVSATEIAPDLFRRALLVADGSGLKHPVEHYHFAAWPDHGVPSSPQPLLHLCKELLASGAHAGAILVHCSAGIGRSGVFCVLDIVTRRLRLLQPDDMAGAVEAVDLLPLVTRLRQQRMGMVQTRDQYVFCHTALLHFVRQLDAQQAQQQHEGANGSST